MGRYESYARVLQGSLLQAGRSFYAPENVGYDHFGKVPHHLPSALTVASYPEVRLGWCPQKRSDAQSREQYSPTNADASGATRGTSPFLESFHPQPTGVTRGFSCWKRVVCSDHLVTVRDVGFGSEEEGPVIA